MFVSPGGSGGADCHVPLKIDDPPVGPHPVQEADVGLGGPQISDGILDGILYLLFAVQSLGCSLWGPGPPAPAICG